MDFGGKNYYLKPTTELEVEEEHSDIRCYETDLPY